MALKKDISPDSIKLLLVDDDEGYLNVLANSFSRRNIRVVKAYSGSGGIQALRKQDFDVALLDLKMEDMDGIEVLKTFKRMLPKLEVIMPPVTVRRSLQAQAKLIHIHTSPLQSVKNIDMLFLTSRKPKGFPPK
ncbi:MAG: response regulator [Pseudomonadota bacterium]